MGESLVVGLGNEHMGDDAVGLLVARRVREEAPVGTRVVLGITQPVVLIDLWEKAGSVVVVDAAAGNAPGAVHRIDARRESLPTALFRTSSHSFGLAEVVELARILDLLPPSLVVYAVEGRSFAPGAELSEEVAAALPGVVEQVLAEVAPRGLAV